MFIFRLKKIKDQGYVFPSCLIILGTDKYDGLGQFSITGRYTISSSISSRSSVGRAAQNVAPKMRCGCNLNRLAYGTVGLERRIFCAKKATFRHRESKASKTPATLNRGGNSLVVLGQHLHLCCRSMEEGTGYCHILSRKKMRRTVPRLGTEGSGSQIVAFLQDCCGRKKDLPEVAMRRSTPQKAGAVSHGPTGRRRTTRLPGAACRSSLLRICLYFGGANVGTGHNTTRRS